MVYFTSCVYSNLADMLKFQTCCNTFDIKESDNAFFHKTSGTTLKKKKIHSQVNTASIFRMVLRCNSCGWCFHSNLQLITSLTDCIWNIIFYKNNSKHKVKRCLPAFPIKELRLNSEERIKELLRVGSTVLVCFWISNFWLQNTFDLSDQ